MLENQIKTMDMWNGSGLSFDEFAMPGDKVDGEIVDYFLNVLPPITNQSCLMQCSEPCCHVDDGEGHWRATYTTFAFEKGTWIYKGECFAGKTEHKARR